MPLQTGQVLQRRYHIIRLLGQGGMGSVYLAKDLRLEERRCAIKEQVPDPNVTPKALTQLRQQFHIEARTLAKLDHPNLPKVSDYFSYAGNEYLVMDYIEGKDLESALQKFGGPLPEQPMLGWAIQVLNALEHLHKQDPPIIHRDIKPANIILTRQGEVKLVDFGLVKLLDATNPRTVTIMRGMGTPEYTPLEQYASNSSHTDGRTDIYAFAATLYHLLTGMAPPDAPQRVIDPSLLILPRKHNPTLSQNIETIILKGMSIAAEDRFQSARLLRDALQKQLVILNADPIDTTKNIIRPRTGLETGRKKQKIRKIIRVAQIFSLLVALFLLGNWVYHNFSETKEVEAIIPTPTILSVTTKVVHSPIVIASQTPNPEDYPLAGNPPAKTATIIPTQTTRPSPIPSNTIVVPNIPSASNTPLPIIPSASNTPLPIIPTKTPISLRLTPTAVNLTANQVFPTAVSATTTIALDQTNQDLIARPNPTVTVEEDTFTALATENKIEVLSTLTPTIPIITIPTATIVNPTATIANPTATATFPAAAAPITPIPITSLDENLAQLGVSITPATLLPGQSYWRVREITAELTPDSPKILIDVQDETGQRPKNKQVRFISGNYNTNMPVENIGYFPYSVEFEMEITDQSYMVSVADEPSEIVQGLRAGDTDTNEETSDNVIYFIIFEQITP